MVMIKNAKEILVGGVFIFTIGFIVWPPYENYNYWVWISDEFIGSIIIVPVFILSILLGLLFNILANIKTSNFIISSILMYVIGIVIIESVLEPLSPAHLILYGIIVAGFVVSVATSNYLW